MPRYLVRAHQRIFYGNQSATIEVEANSETAAKKEAKRKYESGEIFFDVDDVQEVGEPRFEADEMMEQEPAQ